MTFYMKRPVSSLQHWEAQLTPLDVISTNIGPPALVNTVVIYMCLAAASTQLPGQSVVASGRKQEGSCLLLSSGHNPPDPEGRAQPPPTLGAGTPPSNHLFVCFSQERGDPQCA